MFDRRDIVGFAECCADQVEHETYLTSMSITFDRVHVVVARTRHLPYSTCFQAAGSIPAQHSSAAHTLAHPFISHARTPHRLASPCRTVRAVHLSLGRAAARVRSRRHRAAVSMVARSMDILSHRVAGWLPNMYQICFCSERSGARERGSERAAAWASVARVVRG